MGLPSISQGQIAIDPVNRIFYYLDSDGNLVNSSLNLLQQSNTSITTEENLTVNNITVLGSTTSIESTVTTLKDPIITLGGSSAPTLDDNKDRGVEFMWHNGTSSKKGFFGFDDSTGKFTFIPDATNSSEVFSGSIGEINANITWDNVIGKPTFVNSLTGTSNEINVTSTTGAIIISLPSTAAINISGTAVGWTTPRKITLSGDLEGNVFIDGGSNVTLSANIVTNSVTLGTDTTGDYVANLTSGTGITIVSGSGEQSQPIISVTNNIYDAFGAAAVAESNAATDASTKASTAYSNAVTHTNTGLSLKANIASPTFTGTVTTPILIVDVIEIDTIGATTGQVLRYNGTKFEPATESGPSGPTGATGPAGPATTDASLLISGILPDARLSSAIARISSPTFTGTVSGITATMVGLGLVDNTSDTAKPVSTAQQTAIGLKANLASPTFTGNVTIPAGASISGFATLASPTFTGIPIAPTAALLTDTTQIATTAFVRAEVANLVNSAGATLDTLGEIATALGNDASLSTTLTNSIALKAPLASPTFTGTVTLPASTVTSAMILDGTIVDVDINSSAAIAYSKLSLSNSITTTDLVSGAARGGFNSTLNAQTASYTLQATDLAKLVTIDSASNTSVTVPNILSDGDRIDILRKHLTGEVTLVGDTGVTVNGTPGLKLRAQWSGATLVKLAANTWVIMGDLKA